MIDTKAKKQSEDAPHEALDRAADKISQVASEEKQS